MSLISDAFAWLCMSLGPHGKVLTGLRRDMFGACLREAGMADLVCQEVAGASARAPALSFLAAIARDHGAMPQALVLFRCPHAFLTFVW